MTTRLLRMQRIKGNTFRHALTVLRLIVEPSATVEAKKRRSLRLLSAFLLIMTINTMIGGVVSKNAGNSIWPILLATSAILLVGYVLSRTRYHRMATVLAVTILAVPVLTMILLRINQANIPNELPWLALPLLVSTLLLSLRYTIIIAVSYIFVIIVLMPLVTVPAVIITQSLAFMFMIFFFVVAVAAVRQHDQSEIENQLTERKQAEEKLRESEEKFSKAFHASPDIIAITTLKDGKIIEVNDSFTRVTGYNREDVTGHNAIELDLWPNSEQRDKIYKKLREKGQINQEEFDMRNRAGEIRRGLFSAEPINIGGEPCIISVITDITERKQAEEKLRFSDAAFKSIHESVIAVDIEDMITHWNEISEQTFGIKASEATGKKFTDVIEVIESKLGGFEEILKIPEEKGHIQDEQLYHTKQGDVWVDVHVQDIVDNGKRYGRAILASDITERKQAEEKLRESEEKFSKAFYSSPDSISITTLKDGTFIEVNDGHTQFSGYTREEVIGRRSTDFNTWAKAEDRARMLQKLKKQGKVHNEEFDFLTKSGEIRTALFSAETINIGGEPCIIATTTDITERKRAEEKLRESEEKFSKAFRSSPNTMVITTLKDGKFIEVNDSHNRITGYSREETIGHSALELGLWIKAEDRTRMTQILKEHGRVCNEEFEFRMKSGEIRNWLFSAEHIDIGGEPCIISMTIDITELKRAEEALTLRAQILDSATDSIFLHDFDGNFIYVNETACRTHGYSRDEFVKMKLSQVITPERVSRLDSDFQNMLEKGQATFESVHLRKDGSAMPAEVHGRTIESAGGKLLLTVIRDITERKAAEEKLKQALSNLEHSSAQLAAINKELEAFSYSVSHDLRAPLRSIDGFSQALLEDYLDKLDEQGQDYLNRLRNASQKMGELIDGLLKLSRLTRSDMHKEKIDLSALAEEITARLKETQPERQVEVVISRGLTASGDRQLLRALLENLLGNAWKFTGKCPQARIEFGATRNGAKKAYFVRDNGAGFDMTYADKLFGAFQRLHEVTEFPGTGIGLATVQRIIHRHGGSVWAEGTVGKGATFYFTLN
jgi:PAS domain S-box-containing protein